MSETKRLRKENELLAAELGEVSEALAMALGILRTVGVNHRDSAEIKFDGEPSGSCCPYHDLMRGLR